MDMHIHTTTRSSFCRISKASNVFSTPSSLFSVDVEVSEGTVDECDTGICLPRPASMLVAPSLCSLGWSMSSSPAPEASLELLKLTGCFKCEMKTAAAQSFQTPTKPPPHEV